MSAEGHRLFLSDRSKGDRLERGQQGGEKRGNCWVLRGCGGPKSPLKVYLSKGSPTAESDTGLLVLMYRLSSQIPQTLSRIHTLKEVQQQCRGGRGGGKKGGETCEAAYGRP